MRNGLIATAAVLCGMQVASAQTPTAGYYPAFARSGYGYYPAPAPYYQGYPLAAYVPNGYYANYPVYQKAVSPAPVAALPEPAKAPAQPVSPPTMPGEERPTPGAMLPEFVGPAPAAEAGRQRFWASVDYAAAFMKNGRTAVPLLTTGSLADAPAEGALGQPGTAVLVGTDLDFGMFSGVRLDLGFFLDADERWSLDLGALYEVQRNVRFNAASDATGNPIIARPFFDVITGTNAAELDSLPGVVTGSSAIEAKSVFVGAEAELRYHTEPHGPLHIDGLFGFRFLHLGESLTVQDELHPLVTDTLTFNGNPALVPTGQFFNPPDILRDQDIFRTANNYYGLQVGVDATWQADRFFADAFAKVALGATDQRVDINGTTTLLQGNSVQVAQGGIFALNTNGGTHKQTEFGVVPEFGLNVGVNVGPHVQLVAGYSFLFWNQVVRPGAQIDPSLTRTLIPSDPLFGTLAANVSGTRPAFSFVEESFWVQFVSIGVNVRY